MTVLFDEDAPRPLRRHLAGHTIRTVQEMGWAGLKNGRLLEAAEAAGFEILLTFDQNLRYQQNLTNRLIAIVVVAAPNKRMETLIPQAQRILAAIDEARTGQIIEVVI